MSKNREGNIETHHGACRMMESVPFSSWVVFLRGQGLRLFLRGAYFSEAKGCAYFSEAKGCTPRAAGRAMHAAGWRCAHHAIQRVLLRGGVGRGTLTTIQGYMQKIEYDTL